MGFMGNVESRWMDWMAVCPNLFQKSSIITHIAHIFLFATYISTKPMLRINEIMIFVKLIPEFENVSEFAFFVRIFIYFYFFCCSVLNWNSICTSNWQFPSPPFAAYQMWPKRPKKKLNFFPICYGWYQLTTTNCRSSNQRIKIRFVHCYVCTIEKWT